MGGIQSMVAQDIFALLDDPEGDDSCCTADNTIVTVAFFELYGGRVQDLLNNRQRLKVLEDGKGEVVVSGLEEFEASDPTEFMTLVDTGNRNRTTKATEANDTSSRSHAICQILLRSRSSGRLRGKLSLVDLAGSERGTDTKSHNRQRRTESSEINKSLLALKECIRALDSSRTSATHVPYRASKLTLILKDCFTSKLAKTTMIATVSPGASSADHTLNTLRYADRVKEKKVGDIAVESPRQQQQQYASSRVGTGRSMNSRSPRSRSPPRKELTRIDPNTSSSHSPRRKDQGAKKNQNSDLPKLTSKDLNILHASLRSSVGPPDEFEETSKNNDDDVVELHKTVEGLFEEEENLLNLHMNTIQENAELLTEEGRLLQTVQGDGVVYYDIDKYASRLGSILKRKTQLNNRLQEKLLSFRRQLRMEEELSKKVGLIS